MRKFLARRLLAQFERRYEYDVSYMRAMLEQAPEAFFKFAKIMDVARHREAAPKTAYHAAKLVGALAEDCGPCTQLAVDMAREAGVPASQIEAVLTRNRAAMDDATALGFRFAAALVERGAEADEAREAVRARWGDKAVIELTLATQIGRVFPMVKAGLGYAKECRRVHVGDRPVDVVTQAA